MVGRRHSLVLLGLPLISIMVTWVFCLQENLQQMAEANIRLQERMEVLQERLDRLHKEPTNESLPSTDSESEGFPESMPFERNETIAGDSLVQAVHIVKAGETLHSIGMKYGISWTALLKLNSLHGPDTIYAGQELKLP